MRIRVILKKYCDEEDFEWNFDDVEDIYFLDESIEIKFIEYEEDKKEGIYTSVSIPKKKIKAIEIHEF